MDRYPVYHRQRPIVPLCHEPVVGYEKIGSTEKVNVVIQAAFPVKRADGVVSTPTVRMERLTVTEKGWPVGQMMETSRMGLEQCLNKMAIAVQNNN